MTNMVIGIDPDLVKSGVAIVEEGKLKALDAFTFFELIRFIDEHKHQALFVLENVEYDKTVYIRPGTSPASMRKIAQNVGMVKGTCRHIDEYLRDCGASYRKVKPLQGVTKRNAKKDAKYFNELTGWTGRTNEDKRDAALLALYG